MISFLEILITFDISFIIHCSSLSREIMEFIKDNAVKSPYYRIICVVDFCISESLAQNIFPYLMIYLAKPATGCLCHVVNFGFTGRV